MINKGYLQIYEGMPTGQPPPLTCTKLNSQMLMSCKSGNNMKKKKVCVLWVGVDEVKKLFFGEIKLITKNNYGIWNVNTYL